MAEQTKTPLDLLSEQTALLAKIQEEIKCYGRTKFVSR